MEDYSMFDVDFILTNNVIVSTKQLQFNSPVKYLREIMRGNKYKKSVEKYIGLEKNANR